jgi:selenocysteine-specific elongation factor
MSQIVIGTAGHIDHGKTALVKALTGTDTDRLTEEKSRGMTIDLGFAYLDKNITIIDVPGHERFIRNMVAGVSTIHIALIVIAVDDGIMPQTREHLHILRLLGVRHGIIALTKTDLAEDTDWIDLVELEIRDLISNTFLKEAPIIRTSVETGEGIEALKSEITTQSKAIKTNLDRGFFHLAVDRVFSKTGFGSVVTGTVLSGKTKTGQELEIIPGNKKAKIRGMQTHGTETSVVKMGDRAAINLAGTELEDLYRGTVIAEPNWVNSTEKLIASVTMIADTKWKLKNRQRVHLHIGTAVVIAKVMMVEKVLEAGQNGNVLFLLEKPAAVIMDAQFIIRSFSPMETIGGCVVLDPNPISNKFALKKWTRMISEVQGERLKQFVESFWKSPKSAGNWARNFHISEKQIKSLIKDESIFNEQGFLFTSKIRDESIDLLRSILQTFHEENPYAKSLSQVQAKKISGFSVNWLSFLLEKISDELIYSEGGYALKRHAIVLSDFDKKLAVTLEKAIRDANFRLLTADQIALENSKKAIEILHILKDRGTIVALAQGLWIHVEVLDKLKNELSRFFSSKPEMKVADFKNITNTSRKTAIPLLEYCDKQGLTERDGNVRLKGESLA